jgi:hypothetical protein
MGNVIDFDKLGNDIYNLLSTHGIPTAARYFSIDMDSIEFETISSIWRQNQQMWDFSNRGSNPGNVEIELIVIAEDLIHILSQKHKLSIHKIGLTIFVPTNEFDSIAANNSDRVNPDLLQGFGEIKGIKWAIQVIRFFPPPPI